MNDTPRTDKVLYNVDVCDGEVVVNIEFARQLERELNEASEMFRKLNIHALNLTDRIKRLEEAGDALSKIQTYDLIQNMNWRKAKEDK